MDDYAGRVLADRYRLPLPPSDEYDLVETRAFDTYSGQEVLVRQIPLPEVIEAEVVGADGRYGGAAESWGGGGGSRSAVADRTGRATRKPSDPAVRRAIEAATAAARIPDHPRLDQVFDVFEEDGSLWIVSELIPARPLAALLAERPLSPHRAAEVAADVLTALRALHAHGWTHRNITARTVLICDDGRVMLTGLAAGAAEEALCGYDPVPEDPDAADGNGLDDSGLEAGLGGGPGESYGTAAAGDGPAPGGPAPLPPGWEYGQNDAYGQSSAYGQNSSVAVPERPSGASPIPVHGARPGAIAAYRAGARAAAARVGGEGTAGRDAWRDSGRSGEEYGGEQGPRAGGAEPDRPHGSHGAGVEAADEGPEFGPYLDPIDPGAGREQAVPRQQAEGPRARARAKDAGDARDAAAAQDLFDPAASAGDTSYGGATSYGGDTSYGAGLPRSRQRADSGSWDDSGPIPGIAGAGGEGRTWSEVVASGGAAEASYRGPVTALAAERARQARITVVGAVTERWAPEQAGPVHENWRLAPPVGPAADLWALGALLYRAVQGHAPYPEESAAELVQLVCSEAPAYAEECGALRPIVESLLRQDPTERPDFEDLRGWLRSLIRSAPEPDVGTHVVTMPSLDAPTDPRRLPVVRRRGELVRKRRAGSAMVAHGRHKKGRQKQARDRPERPPRSLGRMLLVLVLLALVAAVVYALLFMPEAKRGAGEERTGSAGAASSAPSDPGAGSSKGGSSKDESSQGGTSKDGSGNSSQGGAAGSGEGSKNDRKPSGQEPQTSDPADLARGFEVRKDPGGFQVAVDKDWTRRGKNDLGQVRYVGGDYELIVVPGRDTVKKFGGDPMVYQSDKERELDAFRDSEWSSAAGLRRIDVGQRAMAEGSFKWRDSSGRQVYARNLAMILDGRYHLVLVIGPADKEDEVGTFFEQATGGYRATG
ncbi:protein kinase domain-containing protein [Streptomyces sp. H27-D2]|uniref:protein kinase domain-containing protein n=1 Tax=Streptomyces sp. H27-D2 TaxID=3046304 RepID=UPI002DBA8B2F|nr:protein kinase [Streptomyces sp. H27-D2]MEC4017460.1 protein kinase [Streptomyces sp. H27-D2]